MSEAQAVLAPEVLDHARLLLPAGASLDEWRGERRGGIGASDLSAILGLNPYSDAHDVWMNKVLGVEAVENDRMRLGHTLEPFIRDKFIRDEGIDVELCGLLESREKPFMRYTPDGLTSDGGLFEAKSTAFWLADQWADDQVADHAEVQVQGGMFVTGLRHAWVCAMIGGDPEKFEVRLVRRDDEFIAFMVDAVETFWNEYVLTGVEPPLTGRSLDWAKSEWKPKPDKTVNIKDDGQALVKQLRAARHAESVARRKGDDAEAKLRALVKDANVIKNGRTVLGTARTVAQSRVSADLLRADGIDPDDYRKTTEHTRLSWNKGI